MRLGPFIVNGTSNFKLALSLSLKKEKEIFWGGKYKPALCVTHMGKVLGHSPGLLPIMLCMCVDVRVCPSKIEAYTAILVPSDVGLCSHRFSICVNVWREEDALITWIRKLLIWGYQNISCGGVLCKCFWKTFYFHWGQWAMSYLQ